MRIRTQGCFFASIFLVVLITKVEWDNRFLNSAQKANSFLRGEFCLQAICPGENASKSYNLPLKSEACVVLDTKGGEILFNKNMERKLPIASLTKLRSALVFLQTEPDLNDTITITQADNKPSGSSLLRVGETFILADLLHACLMGSSNCATQALVRASGLSRSDFVAQMNLKAKKLGLKNTSFSEPTGLDRNNKSTALDCAWLLCFALQDSVIASVFGKAFHQFVTLNAKKRKLQIGNAGKVLFSFLKVKGGKTGYNGASGWCLGTMVQGKDGREIVAVILGAPTKHDRFEEIRSIVEWSLAQNKKGS